MKKLSIFQVTLLAVFAAIAVAAVLIFSFAIGSGTTNTIGTVLIWGTLNKDAVNAVIRNAVEEDTGLAGVSYVQIDPKVYEQQLTEALARGSGPDVFILRDDYAYKNAGKLRSVSYDVLSKQQFESTFIQASTAFETAEGIVAFPLVADPLVLYWNKDLLAQGGFSEPPRYWDQLYGMAEKLVKKDSSGSITKSAIAFGEYRNVNNAKDVVAMLIMQAEGAITSLDDTGRLISSILPKGGTVARSSESALRFYTEFADPSKVDYSWNRSLPEAKQAFIAGDLALYVGYASEEPEISRGNPNLNFAITTMPSRRDAPASFLTLAHVYGFAVTRNGANPVGAQAVAEILVRSAHSQGFSEALGLPSARRDVLAASQGKRLPAGLISTTDRCSGIHPIICSAQIARTWNDPDPDATATIFQSMIENTTSGSLLVTEAIQRADQQLTRVIGQ